MSNGYLKKLISKHPLLDVLNKVEQRQRLQWLSEGMLHNHINHIPNYIVNETEKTDYLEYAKGYKECATFEKWFRTQPFRTSLKKQKGEYLHHNADLCWKAWRARNQNDKSDL